MKVDISVGMPVFKAKEIIWLAMEGLCNQATPHSWELLVCEERHQEQIGKEFFTAYQDRLKEVGCVNVKYIELDKWVPLSEKWSILTKAAKGSIFVMQDADDYSDSKRLNTTFRGLINHCFYYNVYGFFYDIQSRKLIEYRHKASNRPGVNKAFKTEFGKDLKLDGRFKYVDSWIFNEIKRNAGNEFFPFADVSYNDSLFVDGVNNISIDRVKNYDNPKPPFYESMSSAESVTSPEILSRLNQVNIKALDRQRPGEYDMSNEVISPENESTNIQKSLIIPAYNADWCLRDCIDSALEQTVAFDEIIIAVDHCLKTLKEALKIAEALADFNIKVLWLKKHSHCYITINTGLNFANGKDLYVFGADDLMNPDYVEKMDAVESDIVCASGVTVENGKIRKLSRHTCGAVKIPKHIFWNLCGYEPWICAADSEFISRAGLAGYTIAYSNSDIMIIRKHERNLTRAANTGMKSNLRNKYSKIIKNRKIKPYKRTKIEIADFKSINSGDELPKIYSPVASLVIPMPDANDTERLKVWAVCKKWWLDNFPDIELIESASIYGVNGYAKAKVVNTGIKQATAKIIVMADADVIPSIEAVKQCIEAIKTTDIDFAVPHRMVRRLTEKATKIYMIDNIIPVNNESFERIYQGIVGGGIWVISKEAWIISGGMDERFTGWGGQDIAFCYVVSNAGLKIWQGYQYLCHLHHTPQKSKSTQIKQQNLELASNIKNPSTTTSQRKKYKRTVRQWRNGKIIK